MASGTTTRWIGPDRLYPKRMTPSVETDTEDAIAIEGRMASTVCVGSAAWSVGKRHMISGHVGHSGIELRSQIAL